MLRPSIAVLLTAAFLAASAPCAIAEQPAWTVCFSPGEGCTDLIVDEIGHAQASVLVQAYSFTSVPILSALKAAHGRGVDVEVIVARTSARTSKSGSHHSAATYLTNAGIPVWVDAKVAIAHNKLLVLNGTMVMTGSFNFTAVTQKSNAENLLVIRDPQLAAEYRANWESRRAASFPYTGPVEAPSEAQE